MASSLSNLVYNLAKGIHKLKCKNEHDNKKYEMCGIRYKDCDCFLGYTILKDDLIECKCLCCNKNLEKKFDENLKKRFSNTHKLSNHDIDKFILLLRKGFYSSEHIDDWETFNETSLPEKEDFYSHLNMEDTTDVDYTHTKRI